MNDYVIHKNFENASLRFFNNIAIDSGVQSITYRELNACANRVAHALTQFDVAPESVVGIYIDTSIEYVIAMLGVLKAGATFIPINHKFPEKLIISIIDGTIYEKKANNSGRQLDEVVKFRHFSSNEAAYR